MKPNQSWLAMLAIVTALTAAQPGSAQSRYTVTDLGTLPGLGNTYVWGGVNSQGHVAGYSTNFTDPNLFEPSSAFLWKGPGEMQLLPQLPGTTLTIAFALNDLDLVVGSTGPTPEGYLAALWEGGTIKTLGKLPGYTDSDAMGINNSGLVVGHSIDWSVDPWTSTAVYWQKGKIFPLPPLDGAPNSHALGVNEWGQIVGQSGELYPPYRAVLWSTSPKAGVTDLGTLGGDGSIAYDINECGQIVGIAQTAFGEWLPVLWDGMDTVELQIPAQDVGGYASSINNRGQIVGYSDSDLSGSDIHKMHALLWEDGRMIELQTQIPNNSGWKLRRATGINDQGQITGFGQFNGKIRAFLLTPTVAPQANATDSTAPDAMAANKPPPLWPAGAELWVNTIGYGSAIKVEVSWPIAIPADHYRLTVKWYSPYKKSKLPPPGWTQSPVTYTILDSGRAYWQSPWIQFSPGSPYTLEEVTVTAYSGPDEATAHSESLNWPPKPGNGPR